MKKILLSFLLLFIATMSYAQIGYQVSLLNTATGEPRANEKVSCFIQLSNSEGAIICSETKSTTSNDFGVISLTVGNAETFKTMDWNKLPLYVSVSVDDKLVGQSQVLTVPVAEYAKKTGTLTYENIGKKRVIGYESPYVYDEFIFTPDSHAVKFIQHAGEDGNNSYSGEYYIDGNSIWYFVSSGGYSYTGCAHYIPEIDSIIANSPF